MKNRVILVGILLGCIIIFNVNVGFAAASSSIKTSNDADNDGIDDSFELYNKRKISTEVFSSEATITSVRVNSENKDQITTEIALGEDGIAFQISYKSKLELDYELTYAISFYELIEFVDIDFDDIYNPEVDKNIQNFTLKEFSPIFYEKLTIQDESFLHHFRISTVSNNFSLEIYFTEEFTLVGNTLITPSQARIIIEISNFGYLNSTSQLALYTKLISEEDFVEKVITEDEEKGYAKDECSVITTISDYISFFSWNETASIDGSSENIIIDGIFIDETVENGQKIYINYPRGNNITHSTKIGIEDLLIAESPPFLAIFLLVLAIGAVSSVIAYSVYYQKKYKLPNKADKRYREGKPIIKAPKYEMRTLFHSELALKILAEEDAIAKLYTKGDINITAISDDFYETIDNLGFTKGEKKEFIRELLSLRPFERELILRDMIIKSQ